MLSSEIKDIMYRYFLKTNRDTIENKFNICAWVYDLTNEYNDSATDIIQYFLQESEHIFSDNSTLPEVKYSLEEILKQNKKYGSLAQSILQAVLSENYCEEKFYCELWKAINSTYSLNSDESKVFALFYIWIDVRIPYFHLEDGLSMDNQKFKELTEAQFYNIEKIRFIINSSIYSTRTEKAKVVLDVLERVANIEERTVLMAHIMFLLSLSITPELRTIFENLPEDVLEEDSI